MSAVQPRPTAGDNCAGGDERPTPPLGRVPKPPPPSGWAGVGGDRDGMPPRLPGTVYRRRWWRRALKVGIWGGLVIGALLAVIVAGLAKILIL